MALISDLVSIGESPERARFLGDNEDVAIIATGTTQGTAYQLSASVNFVTTGTPGVSDGVKLPSVTQYAQTFCVLANSTGGDIQVYPFTGQGIMALGANNPLTVANATARIFAKAKNASGWLT